MDKKPAAVSARVISDIDGVHAVLHDLSCKIDCLEDDLKQDIVNNASGKVTPYDAVLTFFSLKNLHEQMDILVKKVYHMKDGLEKKTVPAVMENHNTDMVRVPELRRSFSINEKVSATFLDREAGYNWLREIGQGDIITETVNAGTLSALVRSLQLEQGIDPPEDVVKVSRYKAVSVNKYTPKG